VWSDVLEQLHNSVGARELDLELAARATSVEFATLLLECVQGVEAEKLHEDVENVLIGLALGFDLLESRQIVLDNHPLGVSLGKTVEVNKQVVPGLLLLVTVLGGFEGKEGDAPCEGSDEVLVRADDVECTTDGAALVEVCQDCGGVVGGLLVVEDRAGGFEEL
jgi:hypothetical protein